MKRTITLTIVAATAFACQASDSTEAIANLTKRVEALEKKVVQQPQRAPARPARPDPEQTYFLPVGPADPYRGAEHAKVTLVEVYEFACPYCALVEPVLAETLKAYEGSDTLKVVSKQFVVHPQLATEAALATCAAHKQGKFEAYAEALWKQSWDMKSGRPRMNRQELGRSQLDALARATGLDEQRFAADRDSPACRTKLQEDRTQLSRIGVRGTPYLFINGRLYNGGRTAPALKAAIDAEAKKVEAALAKGTRLAEYYDGLMKTARRSL